MSKRKSNKDPGTNNTNPDEAEQLDVSPDAGDLQDAPVSGFPVVGIGASAGGLAAFEAFFSGMPAHANPGMAFVVVQHLAPNHKSILSDLVRRYTRMQVYEVEDGMVVQPNCTYIIPPNRDMALLNGALHLLEPVAPRGLRLPIDSFFRSLAQDQRSRAICIVLSGTGTDGTLGARAVKGEGGMVMAQSPDSTEYDGMPRSVISTGIVDYELPPSEMPAQLIAYATHSLGTLPRAVTPMSEQAANVLKKVFVLLRTQTGHDFSQYKPNTIHRRILRSMAVHQIKGMDEYVRYMQKTPSEVDELFRDMLIGVTSFFRDPEAFKVLEAEAIPRLFAGKTANSVIRVWVAGCSTGEEAYSIAILLTEHMEKLKQHYSVQIFATDIDDRAIATARVGRYPAGIASDLSPERLKRFFSVESDDAEGRPSTYRIHKSIRDLLVFSCQDVIKDPPFSKLGLISCRNLMIYMGVELQKKLIPLFHYALAGGGMLFLGGSETVGDSSLFAALDRKSRVYVRGDDLGGVVPSVIIGRVQPPILASEAALLRVAGKTAGKGRQMLRELTERELLQQVISSGVLVDGKGDILYLHGRTGMYLEPAQGEAGISNILKMAREGLRQDLTVALHKAVGTQGVVQHPGLRVKTNGEFTTVNLTVRPVAMAALGTAVDAPPLYLVIMEEAPDSKQEVEVALHSIADAGGPESADAQADKRVEALTQELRAKEQYLQAANEELETSNEELKSSNEEMQSVNEELQSTNEELETSKEELQSVNEELATVNAELQAKVSDLSRANNDMNNLLAGTGIGTVFVDTKLRLLRFTPAAAQIINLIPGDMGRPVGHVVSNLVDYNHLVADVQAVLDTLIPKEVELQVTAGGWYTMRIQPYRTLDNVIEGAVITFVDISDRRHAEEILQRADIIGISTVDSLTAHLAVLDETGTIVAVNKAWHRFAENNSTSMAGLAEGANYLATCDAATGPDSEGAAEFAAGIRTVLQGKQADFMMEYPCHSPTEQRWFIGRVTRFISEGRTRLVIAHDNITERKKAEDALKEALNDIQTLRGILPICSHCKKIRDDKGYWSQVEVYIRDHSEAKFSHGVCPECMKTQYPELEHDSGTPPRQ